MSAILHRMPPQQAHSVLFVPVGSSGDLFPLLGIARGLRAAGTACSFASGPEHKDFIEREGFRFHEVPFTLQEEYAESNMRFAQSADGGDGSIWRDVLLPQLSAGIDALVPLIAACDVAVAGFVSICVPAAAELARKPWVSLQLTGLPFLSALDPPVHSAAAATLWARGRAPLVWHVAQTVGATDMPRQMMRKLGAPLAAERARRGLEAGTGDVLLETVSPFLTLGMFPQQLWPPQPDWPPSVIALGPVGYESPGALPQRDASGGGKEEERKQQEIDESDDWALLSPELRDFILGCGAPDDAACGHGADSAPQAIGAAASAAAGESPQEPTAAHVGKKPPLVVFALGSVAVESAGALAGCFASAAKAAGMRAVILAGRHCEAARAAAAAAATVTVGPCDWTASKDVLCAPHAPYAPLFRRAAVVVHQGGAGTTARALCAGAPTVILPLGMDTWDNALRAERLGVSVTVPREGLTAGGLSAGILLAADPATRAAAREVGLKAAADEKTAVPAAVEAIIALAVARTRAASSPSCGTGNEEQIAASSPSRMMMAARLDRGAVIVPAASAARLRLSSAGPVAMSDALAVAQAAALAPAGCAAGEEEQEGVAAATTTTWCGVAGGSAVVDASVDVVRAAASLMV